MNQRGPKRTNNALITAVAWRLKALRTSKGFSQEYVHEHTGINMQRSESGKTAVSLITLGLLCDFYDLSLEEFFKGIRTE